MFSTTTLSGAFTTENLNYIASSIIYFKNNARFMEFVTGFFTRLLITRDTLLIEIRLKILCAVESDMIPAYTIQ